MWKTTDIFGNEKIWYSKEEVNQMLDEIKQITLQYTDVPCLEPNWKCENCPDETTDYGKTCMQLGLEKIKKIIDGVQND